MTRVSVLLMLGATFAAAAEQPTLPAQLTLSQALDIALKNSTNIRTAIAQLDQASGRYEQSRSPLLPQLDVGAHQDYLTVNLAGLGFLVPGETGKIGPFGSMDARVFLKQELLNLSHIRGWQSSRAQLESSRLLVDNAHELVALRVVAAYLDALKAKASRDSLLAQTNLADELYKLTRSRANQGVASELDANRAMQQANSLLQQRQESEQTYVDAKLSLANLLQARVTADFDVADEAAYGTGTAPDRTSALQTALTARTDHKSAEASVKAAELRIRSAKATRLPTISLRASDGQSGFTPSHNVNTYDVGGTIDFPIFAGGRTRGEIQEAEGALREAQAALDANREQIEADVQAALSGVQWALLQVETSASNVTLFRQEVEFTRSRFSQGISGNTELVNAQDRLAQADIAHIRAQYTFGLDCHV